MLPDWRSLPSLTALRAFEATARAGSFAGAARALNVADTLARIPDYKINRVDDLLPWKTAP